MQDLTRVALCDGCWRKRHPERPPGRVIIGDPDLCHACGKLTFAGIYIRVDMEAEPAARRLMPVHELALLTDVVRTLRKQGLRVMLEAEWQHLDGLDRFMHGTGGAGTRLITPEDGAVLDACAVASIGMAADGVARIMDPDGAIGKAETAARKLRGPVFVGTAGALLLCGGRQ
jgi:hypothetical protein